MGKKTNPKYKNNAAYQHYFSKFMTLATVLFSWEGLPNNIPSRFIERQLFYEGYCLFYESPVYGLMASKTTKMELNPYGEPAKYQPFNPTDFSDGTFTDKNAVLIRNNHSMIPTYIYTDRYSAICADLDGSVIVNAKAQKTPIIVYCDEKTKYSLMQMYEMYDGNQPVIFGRKRGGMDGLGKIETISTGAPFNAKPMYDLKTDYENEYYTILGIDNLPVSKRERLLVSEAESNNELLNYFYNAMFEERKLACDKINELFGKKYGFEVKVKENKQKLFRSGNFSYNIDEGGVEDAE